MSEHRTDIHKKHYIKILIERTKQNKTKQNTRKYIQIKILPAYCTVKKKIFLALYDYVKKDFILFHFLESWTKTGKKKKILRRKRLTCLQTRNVSIQRKQWKRKNTKKTNE